MTKFARVISIIFIISFSFILTAQVYAGFGELIKPIPEENIQQENISNYQLPTTNTSTTLGVNFQPITINQPSITFGDLLLNITSLSSETYLPPNTNNDDEIATKTAQIKKLIRDLEATYAAQLTEFQSNSQDSTTNHQLPTTNLISPTPFIPIPTLIASVSELANILPQTANNKLPTYNPQPITNFPTPTLTDQLLLISLNNSNNSQPIPQLQPPTTYYQLPTNNKTSYTIALLGDSMTDTLGRDLPYLRNLLKENYPGYTFALLNYGQGSTDLDSGLKRLTNSSNYLGAEYPPLLSYKPDILVIESFAYNHWSGEKYDLDRQWLTIAKIIDTVRANSPETKIILAASIAPNKNIFGDGVLNWNNALKEQSTLIIKAYLQNMVNFATSEHYPLVDAYHPTLDSSGNGLPQYISSYDHLHPSSQGAYLYSQKIVEAIKSNNLIQ